MFCLGVEMNRHGLTRTEIAVLAFCILVLVSLFLPSVGGPRNPGRRGHCLNNLRSIGQASINHALQKGHFPGYAMDFGTFDANDWSNVDDMLPTDATMVSHRKIGTWVVAILPYVDQQPVYELWTDDRFPIVFANSDSKKSKTQFAVDQYSQFAAASIDTFRCPSDTRDISWGANSYACNAGMYHASPVGGVSFAKSMSTANGVFNNKFAGLDQNGKAVATGPNVGIDDITDGLSQTLLFAENMNARPWHRVGFANPKDLLVPADNSEIRYPAGARYAQGLVWHYEHDGGAGGAPKVADVHRVNGVPVGEQMDDLPMTPANAADLARPSSFHTDGVNAVFADGSTRLITSTVDYRVYQAMLTPNGEQSDCPDPNYVVPENFE